MPLQRDIHRLLSQFGLEAPVLADDEEDSVKLVELFHSLHYCVAMVDHGSQFFGELSAGVAAHSLSAAMCALLEASASGKAAISKTRLRSL